MSGRVGHVHLRVPADKTYAISSAPECLYSTQPAIVNDKFEGNPHLCGLKKEKSAKKIQSEADAVSSVCDLCPVHRVRAQACPGSGTFSQSPLTGSTCEACPDDISAPSTAQADARQWLTLSPPVIRMQKSHQLISHGAETDSRAPAYPTLTNGACAGELARSKIGATIRRPGVLPAFSFRQRHGGQFFPLCGGLGVDHGVPPLVGE